MNRELLEKIYYQAVDYCCDTSAEGVGLSWQWEEKFAELIVKECLKACALHDDVESFGIYPIRVVMVTQSCEDNIKKHFGVN